MKRKLKNLKLLFILICFSSILKAESLENLCASSPNEIFITHLGVGIDHSSVIDDAIEDLAQIGGGVILFDGDETYRIESAINLEWRDSNDQRIDIENVIFKSTHGKAIIEASGDFSGSRMFYINNVLIGSKNISFENIHFLRNKDILSNAKNSFTAFGIFGSSTTNINENLSFRGCVFEGFNGSSHTCIGIQQSDKTYIKDCTFRSSNLGISYARRNSNIRIENNTFEPTLTNNPIRISGNYSVTNEFSDHIWILNNRIEVGAAASLIDDILDLRDPNTGFASLSGVDTVTMGTPFWEWRWGGGIAPSAIYIHNSNTHYDFTGIVTYHEDVFIDGNYAEGPDRGFFDGGTADLFSIKDVLRLELTHNIARNGGDLGFSIERSDEVVVSGNQANRNNSGGIALTEVHEAVVTGNVLKNNGLRRDGIYDNVYGHIILAADCKYVLVEGNLFHSDDFVRISFENGITYDANLDGDTTDLNDNARSQPMHYGVSVRTGHQDYNNDGEEDSGEVYTPTRIKIAANSHKGNKWGQIHTENTNTMLQFQLNEGNSYSIFPSNEDHPEGTWFHNSNLNNSAHGWGVINREETVLTGDGWSNASDPFTVESFSDMEHGDIVGIELDDDTVHWTTLNGDPASDVLTLTSQSSLRSKFRKQSSSIKMAKGE